MIGVDCFPMEIGAQSGAIDAPESRRARVAFGVAPQRREDPTRL